MIVMHATVPVDRDKRDSAIGAASEVAEASRAEDGVVDYQVAVDIDDDTVLRFIERYENEAAVEAHMGSDHFLEFQSKMEEFVGGEVDLVKFEVAEAEVLA